jgi:hypothetical protein
LTFRKKKSVNMQARTMPHRIAKRRKEGVWQQSRERKWERDKVCTVQEERDIEEEIRRAKKEESEIGEKLENG